MTHYVRVNRTAINECKRGIMNPPICVRTNGVDTDCWGIKFQGTGRLIWKEDKGGPFNNACWFELDGDIECLTEPPQQP